MWACAMNEFTKEELIFMRDSFLQRISSSSLFKYEDYENLHSKIQSMIDNYCEHNIIGEMTGTATFPYCNKCHKAIFIESEPGHDNQ
jgi:hypothetical protein